MSRLFQKQCAEIGIAIPRILLPRADIDISRWAVIACDQHTTDADYWQRVEQRVSEAPSSLRLVLPEIYLSSDDLERRITTIHNTMRSYLAQGLLVDQGELLVLVEHHTDRLWHGLLVAVDLARYDYRTSEQADQQSALIQPTLIRPTEATIESRLPARVRIRTGAALELPHILMLIDDPNNSLFAPLIAERPRLKRLYDFELMLDGGRLVGYALRDEPDLQRVADGLTAIASAGRAAAGDMPLFAVGDGNHSLAAAQATWLEQTGGDMQHPQRFALVELLNIRDPAVRIEPIHRLLRGGDEQALRTWLAAQGWSWRALPHPPDRAAAIGRITANELLLLGQRDSGIATLPPGHELLPAEYIEAFLDQERQRLPSLNIEYVHGTEVAMAEWRQGALALLLPPLDSGDLFRRIRSGTLMPRKSFSIGSAGDKRYYLEARSITLPKPAV